MHPVEASPMVEDVTERQESPGARRSESEGCSEDMFFAYCEDIRDQPEWREIADKDADYYDGNQLTAERMRSYQDRGVDPIIANLVKPTIDVVLGMEARMRTDWRVTADDDAFMDVAEALSMKLHEAERESRADRACSDAYASQVKTGIGWIEVSRQSDPFRYPYRVQAVHRREVYWDWRARDPDLSNDARYLIRKRWFDIDEVEVYFPNSEAAHKMATGLQPWFVELESGRVRSDRMFSPDQAERYYIEDLEWRDTWRRRVALFETWYRKLRRGLVLRLPDGRAVEFDPNNLMHAIAVSRGMVRPQPAIYSVWGMAIFMGPYKLADFPTAAKSLPYVPLWGYREDLTSVPYGLIRPMISPQDEVNARRNKMLHILSSKRVIADSDALDPQLNSVEEMMEEIARPDAAVFLNPNRKNRDQYSFRVEQDLGLSQQQYQIMRDAEETIQKVAGVFNAMLGRDTASTSGIAINSLVEQGSVVLAEINDNYRFGRRIVGEKLLELVKEDLMGQPVQIIVGEANRKRSVSLNIPKKDPVSGMGYLENDITKAPVRVALEDVASSPAYRQQLFVMMGEVIKGMPPQVQGMLAPFWIEASEHPKRKEMAEQVRKGLGIVAPQTPEEEAQLAQEQKMQQMLQMKAIELDLEKKAADVDLVKANAEKVRAEIAGNPELGAQAEKFQSALAQKEADAKAELDRLSAELVSVRQQQAQRESDFAQQIIKLQQTQEGARIKADADIRIAEIEREREQYRADREKEIAAIQARSDKALAKLQADLDGMRAEIKAASEKPEREERGEGRGEGGEKSEREPMTIVVDATGKVAERDGRNFDALSKALEKIAAGMDASSKRALDAQQKALMAVASELAQSQGTMAAEQFGRLADQIEDLTEKMAEKMATRGKPKRVKITTASGEVFEGTVEVDKGAK